MVVSRLFQYGKNVPCNVTSRRLIHSSAVHKNMMDWFRKNKKDSLKPVEKTENVIKRIEQDGGASISASSEVGNSKGKMIKFTPDNFIGEEIGFVNKKIRKEAIANVSFNKWLNSDKVHDELKFDEILIASFNESSDNNSSVKDISNSVLEQDFEDLVTKFKFTKLLQAKTGYLIPDYKLTTLNNPLQFKNYFVQEILSGKQQRFKESEPNAIHLTSDSFKSKNIRVIEDVAGRSQKKTKNKVLSELHLLNSQLRIKKLKNSTN